MPLLLCSRYGSAAGADASVGGKLTLHVRNENASIGGSKLLPTCMCECCLERYGQVEAVVGVGGDGCCC